MLNSWWVFGHCAPFMNFKCFKMLHCFCKVIDNLKINIDSLKNLFLLFTLFLPFFTHFVLCGSVCCGGWLLIASSLGTYELSSYDKLIFCASANMEFNFFMVRLHVMLGYRRCGWMFNFAKCSLCRWSLRPIVSYMKPSHVLLVISFSMCLASCKTIKKNTWCF